jgi:hypothetical protein
MLNVQIFSKITVSHDTYKRTRTQLKIIVYKFRGYIKSIIKTTKITLLRSGPLPVYTYVHLYTYTHTGPQYHAGGTSKRFFADYKTNNVFFELYNLIKDS